jgi:hypothetical protein
MRGMSMIVQPGGRPTARELRRVEITQRLHDLGAPAILALTRALRDPDVQMRRNASLVLIFLGGGYGPEAQPALDTRAALPSLIVATKDPDRDVRGWAAHAIGVMGPAAEPAIPALLTLVRDPEEGPRNASCSALGRIGPAAKPALPALREALKDPSSDVRRFAQRAIERIEQQTRRFGDVGRSLSEREMTRIADLANAAGKPAWLVLGFPSMVYGVTTLTVYLRPDATTERLSRGRLLRLTASDVPVVSKRSDWRVNETVPYAYVPLLGRAGEIEGVQDLAWPFAVDGEIDDDTLISLVTFVRSRPPLPGVPEGQAPREVKSLPLSLVWRRGDQFIVALRGRDDAEVFRVWLVRKAGRWLVTKWDWTIV